MKRICIGLMLATAMAAPTYAAEPNPIGEWSVADGNAYIRVENCNGKMWGAVSWEKEAGTDSNNPDTSKQALPTLGMPILHAMKQTQPNKWEGQIYNSENGKFYTGNISLSSPDILKVEGCLLGFLCGGQSWPRVRADAPRPASVAAPGAAPARPTAGAKTPAQNSGSRTGAHAAAAAKMPTAQEFCTALTRREPSVASP